MTEIIAALGFTLTLIAGGFCISLFILAVALPFFVWGIYNRTVRQNEIAEQTAKTMERMAKVLQDYVDSK
jgi:hypothetical protein